MNMPTPTQTVLRLGFVILAFLTTATSTRAQEAPSPLETGAKQVPQRIACVGDSITEGNANPDYLINSWPLILGRMLEAHAPGAHVVENFGRSGATLLHTGRKPYKDQDVYAAGLAFLPDQVLINLGTNDATNVSWSGDAADFEKNLRQLIGDYRNLESKPRILLSNLTPIYSPYPKEPAYVERRVEFEAIIERLAKELNLKIVDFKTPLLDKPKLFPDGLHPNTAGNEILAAAVFEALIGSQAPRDESLKPKALDPDRVQTRWLLGGELAMGTEPSGFAQGQDWIEVSGKNSTLRSWLNGFGPGDFHLRARLRMLNQKDSAAGFALGDNFFGFEGASGTVFRNGPNMLGLKLLHPADLLWKRDAWIDFEVIRNGSVVWFLVDGFICEMATIEGPIHRLAFEPMRSRMQVSNWTVTGDLTFMPPTVITQRSVALPWVDGFRGSGLDPMADWKSLEPESNRPLPNAVIMRTDGSVFQLRSGKHTSTSSVSTYIYPFIVELTPHISGLRQTREFGDWDNFTRALDSRLTCTPLRPETPLICLASNRAAPRTPLALSSEDEGRTWSKPFQLPAAVAGYGHHFLDLPDGRLGIVFVDRHPDSPTLDDLVLWVGTRSDLLNVQEGQWTARLFPGPTAMNTILKVVGLRAQPGGKFEVDLIRYRGIERVSRTLEFDLQELEAKVPTLGFDIPTLDLDQDEGRHVVVDREAGQYLGHVTTSLLPDSQTILAVYPKGHGKGPIVYKRSPDGGKTWSERLPTPDSWNTSQEVPTIHRLIDPRDGTERLIVWSGLYPARRAYSEDDGATWSELEQVGDWGGIVVMGFVEPMHDGSYLAMFHDDGRFFRKSGSCGDSVYFTLYQTRSYDGGLTWSHPESVWSGSDLHLCEPGAIRSPDGTTLAVLLRENSRRRNSQVIFSTDEAKTWSAPRELPAALTGDRHTAKYGPDGRLFICFRDTALESSTQGDWVGWVGTFDDILQGNPGQYRIRFKDNLHRWDTTYPGVEILPDGTFVVTTYGHWEKDKKPYILSVRFTLPELDRRLGQGAK
ncbi:MAG: GDSL-type esterase/lipase family protein [Planctomycetota bacterium]|nr:GDSL-type esterase/lipase family protein [Planctomycetota bacterium]